MFVRPVLGDQLKRNVSYASSRHEEYSQVSDWIISPLGKAEVYRLPMEHIMWRTDFAGKLGSVGCRSRHRKNEEAWKRRYA